MADIGMDPTIEGDRQVNDGYIPILGAYAAFAARDVTPSADAHAAYAVYVATTEETDK